MQEVPASGPVARSLYKLVFLGDEGVGKTSIITRFMYDTFDQTYKVTVGIDFVSRFVTLKDQVVRLQLWDTAGQERFRALIPSYIRDSAVAIITYDVTSRTSFINTKRWIDDVRDERGDDVLIMLCGNKTDAQQKREVSLEEGEAEAKKQGVMFIETSAKAGFNVKALFHSIALRLSQMQKQNSKPPAAVNIKLDEMEEVKQDEKMACCNY
ncbi:hypothetical protein AAMO2058_001550900 [Amorphochlora amoebiformis]